MERNHALLIATLAGAIATLGGCDPATTAIRIQNSSNRAVRAELLNRGPGLSATIQPKSSAQVSDRNFIGSSIDVGFTDTMSGKFLYAKRYTRDFMEGSYAKGEITLKFPPPSGVETIELSARSNVVNSSKNSVMGP